jgi:hypothetical protein
MSIFDGIFGTMGGLGYRPEHQRLQFGNRQPSGCENSQSWQSQRTTLYFEPTADQIKFAQLIGAGAGLSFPNQYGEGLANNRQVTCAYCRTGRMSMHKTCKGCGASEVMG